MNRLRTKFNVLLKDQVRAAQETLHLGYINQLANAI